MKMNKFKFSSENLLNSSYQNKPEIKEHILTSDIIMVDIDPHTGILEYEFYLFLKKNNYKGIIIFDDIMLSKPGHKYEHRKKEGHFMFQNLWEKIPDNEKIDITHLGHESGTSIVNFNPENKITIL